MNEPVLLKSGFEGFIPLVIIIISVVSWLVNYLKEQQKPQGRPQRPAPQQPPRVRQPRVQQGRAPAQQQLQNEIDLFLQKTGGRQQAAEPVIEIIPEENFANAEQPRRLLDRPEHSLDSHLADRHIAEKNLGSGIRHHVNTHAGSNELDFIVDQRMDDRVDESVQSHLGSFSGDIEPKKMARSETAEQIFRLFQTPQGVRQAVIMQEVLTRKKFS